MITILMLFLTLFGLSMIFNVSSLSAVRDFGDKFYYVKEQMRWIAFGIIVFLLAYSIDYHALKKIAYPLFLMSIFFLIAVFIPGIGIRALGASRWVNLGFFTFQPSEMAKLGLIIYGSYYLSDRKQIKLKKLLVILGCIVVPIILQPDLGSAVVLSIIFITMYFLSGAPLWYFFVLIPLFSVITIGLSLSVSYRMRRIMTFFNWSKDPLGDSYHIRQILIALGSGGLFGVGLGKSRQKFAYLPEVTTDSIFAIIGEELGFIGTSILLLLFAVFIWYGIKIAQRAPDSFGRLVAAAIIFSLSLQILINISAMVSLIPLTGIPLPFISYGGSNLVVSYAMIGILANIAKKGS